MFKKNSLVWVKRHGCNVYFINQRLGGQEWQIYQLIQIKQFEENSYYVQLFGEDQQVGPIQQKHIQDFEEKQDEFSKKAKLKLKDAISKAKKVLEERACIQKQLKQKEQKKRRLSESEDQILKKKNIQTPRQTRIIKKKPDSEPNQGIEYQFQDLLPLLVATQPNYDQIKQKLSPILDFMDGQFKSNLNISDILQDRKGSILNAVFMILKHQSEQNPDHFFQRDVSISIDRMHDILCKLRQNLMEKCFEINEDSPIQQVVVEQKEEKEKIESPKIIEEPIKIQKQIKSPKRTHIHKQPKMIKNTDLNSFQKRTNQIPDPHLRRKVCNVMVKYVQLYGIDEELSHAIVLKLEGLAREQDSSMKCKYGQLMWWTLLNLQNLFQQKSLKKEELLKLIDEPQEIWEKLTQQVPRDAKLQNILIN